jgi:hypothetical protein
MTLLARWLAAPGIAQLVSGTGHAHAVASGVADIPVSRHFSGATFVGQATFLCFTGATSDRPTGAMLNQITEMQDTTLGKYIWLKPGSNAAPVWLDSTGASV